MNVSRTIAAGVGIAAGMAFMATHIDADDKRLTMPVRGGIGSAASVAFAGVGMLVMHQNPGSTLGGLMAAAGFGAAASAALIGFVIG